MLVCSGFQICCVCYCCFFLLSVCCNNSDFLFHRVLICLWFTFLYLALFSARTQQYILRYHRQCIHCCLYRWQTESKPIDGMIGMCLHLFFFRSFLLLHCSSFLFVARTQLHRNLLTITVRTCARDVSIHRYTRTQTSNTHAFVHKSNHLKCTLDTLVFLYSNIATKRETKRRQPKKKTNRFWNFSRHCSLVLSNFGICYSIAFAFRCEWWHFSGHIEIRFPFNRPRPNSITHCS